MQGAEDEVEGSVLTYVTKTEFRKQRSRSPSCNSRSIGIGHPQSGDRCANTRLNPLDPLRVAEQKFPFPEPPFGRHIPRASLIVRHPGGVAGSLAMPDLRVIGAMPLDHVTKKRAPLSGCFVFHSSQ